MIKITIGSTIIGKSGKKLIVDRVEGDIIYSGELKIKTSAVSQIIPPRSIVKFKLGDKTIYIGSDFNLRRQYAGTLEIWEISQTDINSYTCLKPNGSATSWIESADLQLVEVA
jgi:hypothetical protein